MESVYNVLPHKISEQIQLLPVQQIASIEEIRIRINRPLELIINGSPRFFSIYTSEEEAQQLLSKISDHSIYMMDEELKRGYITIKGGHRIGLAGKVILEDSKVKAIRDVASFNIRIAKEKIGIVEPYMPYLFHNKKLLHTMIIGPPQTGKTTLLRDIARIISTGDSLLGQPAYKVGIVDERSEIAGSLHGIPQMTFGPRVDVLDACPKAEGMMMMIRSMSPDVLIVDEIGREEDVDAILEAVHAGIVLMMTAHGHTLDEVKKRPTLKKIVEIGIFERYMELNRQKGPGTIGAIKKASGERMVLEMKGM